MALRARSARPGDLREHGADPCRLTLGPTAPCVRWATPTPRSASCTTRRRDRATLPSSACTRRRVRTTSSPSCCHWSAAHHRIIAMDMYGFGQSAKPEGPQTHRAVRRGCPASGRCSGTRAVRRDGSPHRGGRRDRGRGRRAPSGSTRVVLSSPSYTGPGVPGRSRGRPGGVDDAEVDEEGGHLMTWWNQRSPYYPPGRPDLLNRFVRDALAPGVDPLEGHLACARYVMEDRIGAGLGSGADPGRRRRPVQRSPTSRSIRRGLSRRAQRRRRRRRGWHDPDDRAADRVPVAAAVVAFLDG